jgi:hypothetical protein
MTEPDTYEDRDDGGQTGDAPIGEDPARITVTSHLDADEADLIEQAIEVPEDPDEATGR